MPGTSPGMTREARTDACLDAALPGGPRPGYIAGEADEKNGDVPCSTAGNLSQVPR